MIGIQITGADRVVKTLGDAPAKMLGAASSSLDLWGAELAEYIRSSKLSGQVLNRRSGDLAASIFKIDAQPTASSVSGGARGGGDLPYARIHEFGGVIPAHDVVAKNARALSFTIDGVRRFAKSVHIPDVQMPERSYMRSAFEEKAPEGIESLRAAVKEAIVL